MRQYTESIWYLKKKKEKESIWYYPLYFIIICLIPYTKTIPLRTGMKKMNKALFITK